MALVVATLVAGCGGSGDLSQIRVEKALEEEVPTNRSGIPVCYACLKDDTVDAGVGCRADVGDIEFQSVGSDIEHADDRCFYAIPSRETGEDEAADADELGMPREISGCLP